MNKKGFTLIELLAIIVVLAIIALIATPIILNIIDKAKKGATQDSVYGIAETAEMYYAKKMASNEDFKGGVFELDDLSYKGKIESGSVIFNEKGKYAILIINGKYCGYKYIGGQEAYVGEVSEGGCKVGETVVTLEDLKIAAGQDGNGSQKLVESATIDENGKININSEEYLISSDGKISKNGTEITDSSSKNEAYEKVVKAILSGTESTAKMLENQDIIDGIKTNDNAVSIICDGFVDYLNAANIIDKIKDSVEYINDNADKLVGGTAVIQEGTVVKDKLENYTDSLNNVVSKIDIIMTNYEAILENPDFIELITNYILEDTELLTKALNTEKFVNIAFENSSFAEALYSKHDITESIIASSSVAINAMKNSSKYKETVCKSNIRIGDTSASEMARASICIDKRVFLIDTKFYGTNSLGIGIGDFINNDPAYHYTTSKAGTYYEKINRFAKDLKIAQVQTSSAMEATFYYYEI